MLISEVLPPPPAKNAIMVLVYYFCQKGKFHNRSWSTGWGANGMVLLIAE